MSDPNIKIPVCQVEFNVGGNTLWVHGPEGGTVLRIKCTGKVSVKRGCENKCAHADMMVEGDIEVCMPGRRKRKPLAISSKEQAQDRVDTRRVYPETPFARQQENSLAAQAAMNQGRGPRGSGFTKS